MTCQAGQTREVNVAETTVVLKYRLDITGCRVNIIPAYHVTSTTYPESLCAVAKYKPP